jgi:hypothetical protein
MLDPITGRDISMQCWNGSHAEVVRYEVYGETWNENFGCSVKECGCLCHPRNQVKPVPVVPGFENPCGNCLGLKEVVDTVDAEPIRFVPCPKCCSAVSTEKEPA